MGKPFLLLPLMMLMLACGPEAGEEGHPPGDLEYEDALTRLYRLDHRVDVIEETENGERRECGLLTDRAYDELESTLAALDPAIDYGQHPVDCNTHGALIHIEGFEHSPFECTHDCCHRDLVWAAFVYTMILTNLDGIAPTYEGEPYVAVEPDQPCP